MPIKFLDPIHGSISIPDEYRIVLESVILMRLKNIKQLGLTSATYPGAVHTRFEHTLGTVAVLIKIMNHFDVKDQTIRNKNILAALLSESVFSLYLIAQEQFLLNWGWTRLISKNSYFLIIFHMSFIYQRAKKIIFY